MTTNFISWILPYFLANEFTGDDDMMSYLSLPRWRSWLVVRSAFRWRRRWLGRCLAAGSWSFDIKEETSPWTRSARSTLGSKYLFARTSCPDHRRKTSILLIISLIFVWRTIVWCRGCSKSLTRFFLGVTKNDKSHWGVSLKQFFKTCSAIDIAMALFSFPSFKAKLAKFGNTKYYKCRYVIVITKK